MLKVPRARARDRDEDDQHLPLRGEEDLALQVRHCTVLYRTVPYCTILYCRSVTRPDCKKITWNECRWRRHSHGNNILQHTLPSCRYFTRDWCSSVFCYCLTMCIFDQWGSSAEVSLQEGSSSHPGTPAQEEMSSSRCQARVCGWVFRIISKYLIFLSI